MNHFGLHSGVSTSADTAALAGRAARMIEIAEIALAHHAAAVAAEAAQHDLDCAYKTFKARRRITRIERDSPEWAMMMQETRVVYDRSEKAKRAAYNAQRRLRGACARFVLHHGQK